jgi:hypothetical protein
MIFLHALAEGGKLQRRYIQDGVPTQYPLESLLPTYNISTCTVTYMDGSMSSKCACVKITCFFLTIHRLSRVYLLCSSQNDAICTFILQNMCVEEAEARKRALFVEGPVRRYNVAGAETSHQGSGARNRMGLTKFRVTATVVCDQRA